MMTDDVRRSLARIDAAMTRVEAASVGMVADGHYRQLRERTQAALVELDAVIARLEAPPSPTDG